MGADTNLTQWLGGQPHVGLLGGSMRVFELNSRMTWVPELPKRFLRHYSLGRYSDDQILQIMWKYLHRETNCQRAWARINHFMPETLNSDKSLDILEFSTAHGAMLEIWRNAGHNVVGTDYAWTLDSHKPVKHKGVRRKWHNALLDEVKAISHGGEMSEEVSGWPYQPIIESLGLDVRLFDGGILPYPFEDKSFDVVCCFQAIEAYGTPDKWCEILEEMCRIARKSVVIGFNPLPYDDAENAMMVEQAHHVWLEMQNFKAHGLQSVFFEVGQTRRGFHPTTLKLMAT